MTSLQVAEAFGKDHDKVLKDIRNLLENKDFSADNFDAISYMDTCNRQKPMFILSRDGFTASNFAGSTYRDSTGRPLPMFTLSRDGFLLLAMGYTCD